MGPDIRLPIGLLFVILGVLLEDLVPSAKKGYTSVPLVGMSTWLGGWCCWSSAS